MKWILLVFLFVYCVAQEYQIETGSLPSGINSPTRIIGGTHTTIEKFPYVVQVQYLSRLACGGSLITRRHVLSAAHCFFDQQNNPVSPTYYTVRAGATYLETGGSVHGVSTIITHENYNRPVIRDNDVAVMLLSSAVTPGASIATAKVLAQGEAVPDNSSVIHVGWGHTNPFASSVSPVLQEVTIRTVNWETCVARYQYLESVVNQLYPVTDNMICSGLLDVGGADACQGDSGGPLVLVDTVVGVTSWGYGCAEPLFPGVNARVSAYTNWINATVNRYNASPQVSSISGFLFTASLLASMLLGSHLKLIN